MRSDAVHAYQAVAMRVRAATGWMLGLCNGAVQDAEPGGFRDDFASVAPCEGLLNIITDTPAPDSRLGNFTQIPSQQLLEDCFRDSSLHLISGDRLAQAMTRSEPPVKACPLYFFCTLVL